jgi:hypothetical protein
VGWVFLFRDSENSHSNQVSAMALRYCFGAPYVCDELAKETVTAGAFAHPAFLKEEHFTNVTSMCTDPRMPKQITGELKVRKQNPYSCLAPRRIIHLTRTLVVRPWESYSLGAKSIISNYFRALSTALLFAGIWKILMNVSCRLLEPWKSSIYGANTSQDMWKNKVYRVLYSGLISGCLSSATYNKIRMCFRLD